MNKFYRSPAYLFIAFIFCYPILQIGASPSEMKMEQAPEARIYTGRFATGLSYFVIPISCLRGGVWIALSSPLQEKENEIISRLTAYSLLYGMQHNEGMADFFDSLQMDHDPNSFFFFNESGFDRLQFLLPIDEPKAVVKLLSLVNQLAFSPIFEDEDIELARLHLLQSLRDILTPEQLLTLQSLTAAEVRAFYSQCFSPQNLELQIIGCSAPLEIIKCLPNIFGECVESDSYPQSSFQEDEEEESF
jgi:predicted Zn-dependent peptidase